MKNQCSDLMDKFCIDEAIAKRIDDVSNDTDEIIGTPIKILCYAALLKAGLTVKEASKLRDGLSTPAELAHILANRIITDIISDKK